MAGRSNSRPRQRREAVAPALPSPSITLDIALPNVKGGVDQRRPTFNSFEDARQALIALERQWKPILAAHKKAARSRK